MCPRLQKKLIAARTTPLIVASTAAITIFAAAHLPPQAAGADGIPLPNPSRFNLYAGYGYIQPVTSDINNNEYQPINLPPAAPTTSWSPPAQSLTPAAPLPSTAPPSNAAASLTENRAPPHHQKRFAPKRTDCKTIAPPWGELSEAPPDFLTPNLIPAHRFAHPHQTLLN